MGLSDDLKSEVAKTFRSQWLIRDGQVVPDTPDLKPDNDGVKLTGNAVRGHRRLHQYGRLEGRDVRSGSLQTICCAPLASSGRKKV